MALPGIGNPVVPITSLCPEDGFQAGQDVTLTTYEGCALRLRLAQAQQEREKWHLLGRVVSVIVPDFSVAGWNPDAYGGEDIFVFVGSQPWFRLAG